METQKELKAFKAVAQSKGWNTDGETTQTNYRFHCLTTNSGWEMWQAAKASVAEWILIDDQMPEEGQKCLVIFEMRHSKDDAYRYVNIDYFNEGDFDSVVNWEDQASSVALPSGSVISRFKAVYWSPTNLSAERLVFNEAQEPSND